MHHYFPFNNPAYHHILIPVALLVCMAAYLFCFHSNCSPLPHSLLPSSHSLSLSLSLLYQYIIFYLSVSVDFNLQLNHCSVESRPVESETTRLSLCTKRDDCFPQQLTKRERASAVCQVSGLTFNISLDLIIE